MKKINLWLVVAVLVALLAPATAQAQSYSFNIIGGQADVYLNGDGTARITYTFVFDNFPYAATIEFVDVAFPSYTTVDLNQITAAVNGQPVDYISAGEYEGDGNGVALALGSNSIQPGQQGTVTVEFGKVDGLVFQDSEDPNYASFEFSPAYLKPAEGVTQWTVSLHLPPGVQPEEPRWHAAPSGWMSEPFAKLDEEGRVTYTWVNENAEGNREYQFGASFPASVLPAGIVRQPDLAQSLEVDWDALYGFGFCACFVGIFILIIGASYTSTQRRKIQYLPPKIAIEGHGIKRGLTAVEAAIMLEQPLDKIMTMILFATIKKQAASVVKQDPLTINMTIPQPEGLHAYETAFLQAFQGDPASRKRQLQLVMIDLVKSVALKMKGFSRKETIAYYKDIVNRAWTQVEEAGTPEVKSDKFSDNLEWTMMDDDYDDRTRRVFGPGPVIVPNWWGRFDPGYGGGKAPSTGSGSGGGFSMPTLPGSAFAGSIVTGVQGFSSKVVGNITDFTGGVTDKTNPVPVSTSTGRSSGGRSGGSSCACACACAGCACACAGGGR